MKLLSDRANRLHQFRSRLQAVANLESNLQSRESIPDWKSEADRIVRRPEAGAAAAGAGAAAAAVKQSVHATDTALVVSAADAVPTASSAVDTSAAVGCGVSEPLLPPPPAVGAAAVGAGAAAAGGVAAAVVTDRQFVGCTRYWL